MIDLFPYRPRPSQVPVIREVNRISSEGGTLLLDASTGTGKTVAVLAPLLEHALAARHKVLYLVRTHAQGAQVLREVRAIKSNSGVEVLAVTLEGREGRCPLMDGWKVARGATPEELGKLCGDRKRATAENLGSERTGVIRLGKDDSISLREIEGCPYFAANLARGPAEARQWALEHTPSGADFSAWAREEGYCPYELSKSLAREAHVVVAPYITFFHPGIRESLLSWIGASLGEIDLVIDEAHNLPENLRELSSLQLSEETVERALREITVSGGVTLADGIDAAALLQKVKEAMEELAAVIPTTEEDVLLPEGALEEEILSSEIPTTRRLDQALTALMLWGDELRENRRRNRLLPRSYAYTVAAFLLRWRALEPPQFLKVACREPSRSLILYSLEVGDRMEAAKSTHSTVHMSGTLAPLEEYREALGLSPGAHLLVAPPSFPPENRRIFISEKATSRRYDVEKEEGAELLRREILAAVKVLPVKTAVFFPSFALLSKILGMGLVNDLEEIGRGAVIEQRGLSTEDLWRLVDGFKRSTEARVLLGVCGGRISEGIDFPNEELGGVILAGIPYPRPSARREALSRYLEATVGNGWEHCYSAPARRSMQQALGRMIRTETDRGIGIILDHRAARFKDGLGAMGTLEEVGPVAKTFFLAGKSPKMRQA